MADIANTSEARIAFVEETTIGTTPASPVWRNLRMTGESLVYDIQNTQSNEIQPNVDVSDLIQTGAGVSGGVNFEMTYGTELDKLLEHALRGTFASNVLKAGSLKKQLSFEKIFETGTTDQYLRFKGNRINGLSLQVKEKAIITSSIEVMGMSSAVPGTAILSGATYTAANTNPVMSAIEVGSITVGGVSGTVYYTDLSFNLKNNCRVQNAIGQLNAIGIAYGRREITGQMTAYFSSSDLYEEFVQGNESSLSFTLSDGSNSYAFNFPRTKYITGRVVAGGNNQDVMADVTWQALYDSVQATSMKVTKS